MVFTKKVSFLLYCFIITSFVAFAQTDTTVVLNNNKLKILTQKENLDSIPLEKTEIYFNPYDNGYVNIDSLNKIFFDKVKTKIDTTFFRKYPYPRTAVIFSLILPGAGQVYNKKYWKLPLVYGALGGIVYAASWNQGKYRIYKNAYIDRLTCGCDNFVGIYDDASIKTIRDYYRKNMELSYIGLTLTYVLVGVDAFVDAHLGSFDVSNDISLRVKPTWHWNAISNTPMPSLSFITTLKK